MLNSILEKLGFKKKKKPLYTKKQFTRYSSYKGDTYVYDSYTNQWLLWYIIASDVDDGSISEFDMIKDNEHSIMADKLYNTELSEENCLPDLDKSNNDTSYENFGTKDSYSGSISSSDWSSSYYSSSDSGSSSSYDSGSSSSFSSSDSGGSCF